MWHINPTTIPIIGALGMIRKGTEPPRIAEDYLNGALRTYLKKHYV